MGYYSSKLFYTREYKLQPFIAPDNFDRSAQAIDIFEKFKSLHQEDETAAFIWHAGETNNSTLSGLPDITWRYGETINGTEVISPKITSGSVFTSGSTKRWVCAYYTGTNTMTLGTTYWYPRWMYIYSDKVVGFSATSNGTLLNYVHFHNLNNLTTLGDIMPFATTINLTGTLHLPSSLSSIDQYAFYGARLITKVNCYRSIAPTTSTNTLVLQGTPRPLHVPIGSSGYNVNPWTNTAIFSSIIADL